MVTAYLVLLILDKDLDYRVMSGPPAIIKGSMWRRVFMESCVKLLKRFIKKTELTLQNKNINNV